MENYFKKKIPNCIDEAEFLLGRGPFSLRLEKTEAFFDNKTVMVTGGGGSIGSELCRTVAEFNIKKLIIFDFYENNAFETQNEIVKLHPEIEIKTVIASIRDKKRVFSVMEKLRPDIIFHAAAHKHVTLMEENPQEAIKNNVLGTFYLAEAAKKTEASDFVLISTDKAVNPTNIMGASKRFCELIIKSYDNKTTRFSAVRFGNVLGSNGSVLPIFKKQIEEGGTITVTHKEATRFFLTIPEAAKLVICAASIAKGGEVFVLDMGSPVKIYDLATRLIELYGFVPEKDIKIETVGLRSGEKIHEELQNENENLDLTEFERIFSAKTISVSEKKIKKSIKRLKKYAENEDDSKIKKEIMKSICEFDG